MLKLFYMLLTDPLGLPIEPLWEYIILLVMGEIVHEIAFQVSPGGIFGSFIYWITKLLSFIVIWLVLYVIIAIGQFVIANWIWFVIGGGVLFGVTLWLLVYFKGKKRIPISI